MADAPSIKSKRDKKKKKKDSKEKSQDQSELRRLKSKTEGSERLRKSRKSSSKTRENKSMSSEEASTKRSIHKSFNEKDSITAVHRASYERFVKEILAVGVDGLLKEYIFHVKPYLSSNFQRAVFDQHLDKNRYKDVICNDVSRVILKIDVAPGTSDYIHANYVTGENLKNSFICTQGPLNATIVDFWRMIIGENVAHIVMLCEVVEAGKVKCEPYWPVNRGDKATYGAFIVHNTHVCTSDPHITKTSLEVEFNGVKHRVKHHHWKTWPDKTVPKSVLACFRILRVVRSSTQKPTVVHCSAGIGRTGSLVAIEMGLQTILADKPLNLLSMVKKLRDQRMHSVQMDVQYVFVAQALCEYGKAMGYWNNPALYEEFLKFKQIFDALVKARPNLDAAPAAAAGAAAPGGVPGASPQPGTTPITSPSADPKDNKPGTGSAPMQGPGTPAPPMPQVPTPTAGTPIEAKIAPQQPSDSAAAEQSMSK